MPTMKRGGKRINQRGRRVGHWWHTEGHQPAREARSSQSMPLVPPPRGRGEGGRRAHGAKYKRRSRSQRPTGRRLLALRAAAEFIASFTASVVGDQSSRLAELMERRAERIPALRTFVRCSLTMNIQRSLRFLRGRWFS